jgi:drug/metabolite transporter (DMT)-like permease
VATNLNVVATDRTAGATGLSHRTLLLAAYAAVYFVWGSTFLAIRYAVETLPPFLMAGTRFLTAGALLYAWTRYRGTPRPGPGRWATATAIGGLLFVANGAICWAERRVPSGLTALLVATVPLWVALLDWLRPRGVRPRPGAIAGLVTGFAATAFLAGPGDPAGDGAVEVTGAVVILLVSLSFAVGLLCAARTARPGEPAALAAGMQMLGGGAILMVMGIAIEGRGVDVRQFSLESAVALAYLTVFGSVVAFGAFAWLLRVEPPSRVATYAFVNPVVAVFLGWAVKGEPVSGPMVASAAVVVGAVALITASKHPSPDAGKVSKAGAATPTTRRPVNPSAKV